MRMIILTALRESLPGYGAIFICIGLGLVFLRRAVGGRFGVSLWSAAFFLNGAGFLLWVGASISHPFLFFVVGDAFHVLGFLTLLIGVYRFTGGHLRRWNFVALPAFAAVWAAAIFLSAERYVGALFLYSAVRAALFIPAGVMILRITPAQPLVGRRLAGWGSLAWGIYVLFLPVFTRVPSVFSLAFGFLVGFQMLVALGLVILVVDRVRLRAEQIEHHAHRLEGLLPICSYCKRIRDENGSWQSIEAYVTDHSKAGFSHGICPDCVKAHFPKLNLNQKIK